MENYPASLTIDYQQTSNRLTVLFRIFLAVPILIILALLTSPAYENEIHVVNEDDVTVETDENRMYSVGIIFLPTLLMIVFRKKYPKWWFDWNLALVKFSMRVASYLLLLRDEYPSTDEEQAVHVQLHYPDVDKELNRYLPLVKWLLAIPHLIVLVLLTVAVLFVTIVTWFIILFTGSYPKMMFDFVVGYMRWFFRVEAYAFLLTTDRYPPFRLSP
ncbi:MAG: DUF4389 domain-containing protein [Caldithrix sp.]|nr:DUF4389 domain-containing protein [Caldithrix sp.]